MHNLKKKLPDEEQLAKNAGEKCLETSRIAPSQMVLDGTLPEFSQHLGSVLQVIEDNGKESMPEGHYLWELIYPQAEMSLMPELVPEKPEGEEEGIWLLYWLSSFWSRKMK